MKAVPYLLAALLLVPVAQASADLKHKDTIYALQRQAEAALRGQVTVEDTYRLAKARAWTEFALDEMYEIDRTGIIEAAIEQAQKLLAGDKTNLYDTPIVRGSERIREDLWLRSAQMKQHKDADCAMRQLAELDVQLVWAGHEKWESGWTHARPYVEVAENLAYEAEQSIARCAAARAPSKTPADTSPVAAPAASTITVPVAAPAASTITVERFIFSTDALFQFDKSGVEHLVAGGQRKLAALVSALQGWKSIARIEIVGHADRLGKDVYNDRLSRSRAESVRDFMVARGLPAELISASGMGEALPVVHCSGSKKSPGLIACLQPNRRVEITVRGEKE